ncbi:hypothetical protein ILYODFUR_034735 [Ilyodon furcidens]|uniref:Uncharacterized protein n=1 Tax=Ilyodon furcidens TaxID=33524 RepID=A0ABV0UC48_9TELE
MWKMFPGSGLEPGLPYRGLKPLYMDHAHKPCATSVPTSLKGLLFMICHHPSCLCTFFSQISSFQLTFHENAWIQPSKQPASLAVTFCDLPSLWQVPVTVS